jgi:two-component system phosphate regulon response regulator PhoB
MHNILLVEDSEDCQLVLKRALTGVDAKWFMASSMSEALQIIKTRFDFSLFVIDLGLPDGNGLDLMNEIKKESAHQGVPVFLYTGTDELVTKVAAFNLGIDDYLVKSMSPVEIRSRIDARLRKMSNARNTATTIRCGDLLLEIPLMRASLFEGGTFRNIHLTGKEFKILCFMIQSSGKVFSREELVRNVWGQGIHVLGRTVDSHICGLRKKLGKMGHYIESIPATGYRFLNSFNPPPEPPSVLPAHSLPQI